MQVWIADERVRHAKVVQHLVHYGAHIGVCARPLHQRTVGGADSIPVHAVEHPGRHVFGRHWVCATLASADTFGRLDNIAAQLTCRPNAWNLDNPKRRKGGSGQAAGCRAGGRDWHRSK